MGDLRTGSLYDESDESLASRAAYDPVAMTELYRRYRPQVDKQCRFKLSNPEDAEDVASQVFLNVLEGLRRNPRIDRFRPWINTIIHNAVVNTYRARRSQTNLDDAEYYLDSRQSPESMAVENDEIRRLDSCLERLPESERQVFELRRAGMTNPEICEMLRKTYSWVGSTQHRALKHLKDCMSDGDMGMVAR